MLSTMLVMMMMFRGGMRRIVREAQCRRRGKLPRFGSCAAHYSEIRVLRARLPRPVVQASFKALGSDSWAALGILEPNSNRLQGACHVDMQGAQALCTQRLPTVVCWQVGARVWLGGEASRMMDEGIVSQGREVRHVGA